MNDEVLLYVRTSVVVLFFALAITFYGGLLLYMFPLFAMNLLLPSWLLHSHFGMMVVHVFAFSAVWSWALHSFIGTRWQPVWLLIACMGIVVHVLVYVFESVWPLEEAQSMTAEVVLTGLLVAIVLCDDRRFWLRV
jgi:hypothetical protein